MREWRADLLIQIKYKKGQFSEIPYNKEWDFNCLTLFDCIIFESGCSCGILLLPCWLSFYTDMWN